jgi:hypothetical protein
MFLSVSNGFAKCSKTSKKMIPPAFLESIGTGLFKSQIVASGIFLI